MRATVLHAVVATLIAANPVFTRRPQAPPFAQILDDQHCLIDAVNKTLRTTRDFIDWGGSDALFVKWWEDHVVDYTLSTENCRSKEFASCLEGKWRDHGVTVLRAAGHSPCQAALALKDVTHPYVYVSVGENWGAFSSSVVNRTANWNYWTDAHPCGGRVVEGKRVKINHKYAYSVKDDEKLRPYTRSVRDWLDAPQLKLLLTTQRQSQLRHPKVMPLPLGVRHGNVALLMALILGAARPHRTRWLLINNSGWQFRAGINALVAARFAPTLVNNYCTKKACPLLEASPRRYRGQVLDATTYSEHARRPPDLKAFYRFSTYGQILTSKFVLCPPGLGPDSYRIWEVLYLGAIPVVERTRGGWDDLLVDLPVLLVDSFEEVTPSLLRDKYAAILKRCGTFDLRRLTKAYYLYLIRKQGTTRLGEGVARPHSSDREGSPYRLKASYKLTPVPPFLRERLPAHLRLPETDQPQGRKKVRRTDDLSKLGRGGS